MHLTRLAFIEFSQYAEVVAAIITVAVMRYRKQLSDYAMLAIFLGVRIISSISGMVITGLAGRYIIPGKTAYQIYFYEYWASYAIEALLGIGIIYSVYKLAMAPLKGLQSLGMVMFRWAAAIAVAVSVGMAFGPHVTTTKFIIAAVTQLQQTQSILTLCLLLFVTFAIRPMGLSYRSKIFGVSFGLGLMATMDLADSAWIAHTPNMVSNYSVLTSLAVLATLGTWTAYFAMPEPKRRIIVLPTTSPFLRWNQISAALGDNPGYVAVGGVHPEIFAPAELEVMRRASMKMIMEPISIGE